jgi:predicted metal-dependent peptidase
VFKWIEENEQNPTVLVFFTDLYGGFPKAAPDYDVLWLSATTSVKVPFGTRIPMKGA